MKLSISIDSNNVGCSTREDVAAMVTKVAVKIHRGDEGGFILDINGNKVGTWTISDEEEDVGEDDEPEYLGDETDRGDWEHHEDCKLVYGPDSDIECTCP